MHLCTLNSCVQLMKNILKPDKMKKLLLLLLTFYAVTGISQTATFDIVTYSLPVGWKSESKVNTIVYSKIEGDKWAQIIIYKNTTSKGNIQADFDSEWKTLVADAYNITETPEKTSPESAEGWEVMSGSGLWQFNGSNVATILTTFSGHGACVSVACNATAERFLREYKSLVGSITLYDGKSDPAVNTEQNNQTQNTTAPDGSFKFNTTNFDDGWTSKIENDWVEVKKGNIKVLLHYPREGTILPAEPDALTKTAWNILVAPRYSNLSNFKTSYVEDFNRPYFASGYATENRSGKPVFIVLFRRSGGWIEFVSTNITAFTSEFGFNPESVRWGSLSEYMGGWVVDLSNGSTVKAESVVFDKLEKMTAYNKFAVAATDLENTGKWSDHYSSNTYYTNIYTGVSAGISTYSSSQSFNFGKAQTYSWQLAAVNSYGGNANVAQAKGDGTFSVPNNWQIAFSDIEGKPKTYDAYFTAVKNGRVLWLNDAKNPGSGIFTGYAKE